MATFRTLRFISLGITGITCVITTPVLMRLHQTRDDRHIVLDLDYTLIHNLDTSSFDENGRLDLLRSTKKPYRDYLWKDEYQEFVDKWSYIREQVEVSDEPDHICSDESVIYKQRWLHQFLTGLNFVAKVHVFSAGTLDYVEENLNLIDPQHQYFDQVLGRDMTLDIDPKRYCKHLGVVAQLLDFDPDHNDILKRMLLVDDATRSFVEVDEENQKPNGIHINPFYIHNGRDNTLLKVLFEIYWRCIRNQLDLTNGTDTFTFIE